MKENAENTIFIRTFDGFEVFVNEQRVNFRSCKAKEMLALLVEKKGSSVSLAQMAYVLYEDTPEQLAKNNIRVIFHRLRQTLEEYGGGDMLIHRRGSFAVDTALFECDLYEMMKGNEKYLISYSGSYMPEYQWAFTMKPYLDILYKKYVSAI